MNCLLSQIVELVCLLYAYLYIVLFISRIAISLNLDFCVYCARLFWIHGHLILVSFTVSVHLSHDSPNWLGTCHFSCVSFTSCPSWSLCVKYIAFSCIIIRIFVCTDNILAIVYVNVSFWFCLCHESMALWVWEALFR